MMPRSANLVAAAVVTAAAVMLFALTFDFEQMPVGLTQGLGAELFPRLVLGTIVTLAILLAITSEKGGPPLPKIPVMVYLSAGAFFVFMLLVEVTGMLAAMFLFLVGLGVLWGERRALVLLAASSIVMLCIWVVFVKGFGIPLPQGYLLYALIGY